MAKTKKESAKNIRNKMVSGLSLNVEEQASKNIGTAKEITNISMSIERLSEDQISIFEKILSTLEEIPRSVRDRELQNEKLTTRIAQAILSLEKQLVKETDETRRSQLKDAISGLTGQGESLSMPSSSRGLSLLEGLGKKYLGFQGQDIEEMRSRGGGLRGMFGAYVPAVKRGFNILAGRNDSSSSFQSKLNNLRAIEDASSEISTTISGSRREKIRDRAEKNVAILLKQIALNTQKTAELLKKATEDTATAGTDYDPENKNNAVEVGGMGGSFSVLDAVLPDNFVPIISGGGSNKGATNKGGTRTGLSRSERAKLQPRDPETGRFVRASASAKTATQGGRFARLIPGLRNYLPGIGNIIGGTVAGYQSYQGVSAANEAYESGIIDKIERDTRRGEAVGEGAGAFSGALAGGAAGGALGFAAGGGLASPITGGLGALIGGAIGGIAGWRGGSAAGNIIGGEIGEGLSEAIEEQRRMNNANALEEQAMRINGENSVINNIDNSQVVNNYATSGSDGQKYGSVSISVRNDESSYMRFQNKRLSRVM